MVSDSEPSIGMSLPEKLSMSDLDLIHDLQTVIMSSEPGIK